MIELQLIYPCRPKKDYSEYDRFPRRLFLSLQCTFQYLKPRPSGFGGSPLQFPPIRASLFGPFNEFSKA